MNVREVAGTTASTPFFGNEVHIVHDSPREKSKKVSAENEPSVPGMLLEVVDLWDSFQGFHNCGQLRTTGVQRDVSGVPNKLSTGDKQLVVVCVLAVMRATMRCWRQARRLSVLVFCARKRRSENRCTEQEKQNAWKYKVELKQLCGVLFGIQCSRLLDATMHIPAFHEIGHLEWAIKTRIQVDNAVNSQRKIISRVKSRRVI